MLPRSAKRIILVTTFVILAIPTSSQAPEKKDPGPEVFASPGLRAIGPALTSGRIVDIEVHPLDKATYYIAAGSGGIWKTTNNGATWSAIFENEGSYSIGDVAIDPRNPERVWAGTGESNAQRSVGWGDGVYRSDDGGRTWRNMGLKNSEHIGRIAVDPRDSDTVYVAAQGPLWGPGGDRGLYKTTDGGKTWKAILTASENTGCSDVAIDPRDSKVLYASMWQRRRHIWTYVGGGPEGSLQKSADGGATWTKLRSGLPGEDLGRIGIAVSPANPDVVYATIEAANSAGGLFRSTNRGATWERRNPFHAQNMYYAQIIADPKDVDRVYVMSVQSMVSHDGGATVIPLGERNKHVDNHALWIDPDDTRHLLEGSDGGLYESFDRGETWLYKSNLPITQFYRVAVDNQAPFYLIYGGTQDNNSLGGPARTRASAGITNDDWFITLGGDGFHQAVDPKDPNIVYSILQYGEISRLDRRTGIRVGIKPVEGKSEPALRWNWDSPLLISPHSPSRLYYAANRLFRSDDRGESWTAASPDLTRQLDRNALMVFGKIQKMDAVAKHQSTSPFGNIVSLTESPKQEGLIYAGTDDGLIQATEDGGKTWRKIERIEGVPERTYVSDLLASRHEANTLYAAFNNHQMSDFKPYLLKSTDRGATWKSLAAKLPERGPVWVIAEDSKQPNLLFCGTEFAAFYSVDGGENWTKLRGLPTIAVRDLAIQEQMDDLVLATFGRGFYVLDDYSPLREASKEILAKPAHLFPVRRALMHQQGGRLLFGRGSQGEGYFAAPNPAYGATFTYYLKEGSKTLRQKRLEAEREAEKQGRTPPYPTAEQLRAEADEEPVRVVLTVMGSDGEVVRRLTGPSAAGVHRVTWDFRRPGFSPVTAAEDVPQASRGGRGGGFRGGGAGAGFPVAPGAYRVSLTRVQAGKTESLAGPVSFTVLAEGDEKLTTEERKALDAFRKRAGNLQRTLQATLEVANAAMARIRALRRAIDEAPKASDKLSNDAAAIEARLRDALRELQGDRFGIEGDENAPPSIVSRLNDSVFGQLTLPIPPTKTRVRSLEIGEAEMREVLPKIRDIVREALPKLERAADAAGAPHTPGRVPPFLD